MIGLLFIVLMVFSCGTAVLLGGRDGRWVASLYVLAVIGTHFARRTGDSWDSPHIPVLIVDAALLVGLLAVTLNSRRYWTIWITGLHLLTVASHAQAWAVGTFSYRAYFVMESVWSPIKLIILLIGVLLDWEMGRDSARRRSQRPSIDRKRSG